MRSLEESRLRWQITTKHATSLDELKKSVRLDGDDSPSKAGLRSIFLLFEGTEITGWSRALLDSRSAYASLREHLLRFIENHDEIGSGLDPLNDDKSSPWNTLRQDEEMRAEIFQDVERCMPEEPYFRTPRTQRMMLDILFIFCKINQDVGYRQGMHELLAPILWVVEQDAIDCGNDGDRNSESKEDELLSQTLDSACVENDAFTLFSLIMRSAKSFYELAEPDRRSSILSSGTVTTQPGASPIVERSKQIHEVYLARLDPGLAKHLTDIEVLPQIFLIRWIRLLFGREFPFDDLLALWDILLAEDPLLDLVDMVCVAMLLRIRWQLVEANYSMALMLLLKYPSPTYPSGPQTFVDDAIYLRDNFSAAGGANIISKYGGRSPPVQSDSRPATPLGQAISPRQRLSRTKSPLPSPARFLQQQGGIEALFQGATKGVFERGEKLGINRAVRDAVGEVKKNMQGLQAARSNSASRRTSDVTRWSLDEGRPIQSSKATILAMNKRNQQLARILDQAMSDLRAVSVSKDEDKDKYIQAMELAIAKVDFVQVYLEDSTMPLPSETTEDVAPSEATQVTAVPSPPTSLPPLSPSPSLPIISQSDLAAKKPPLKVSDLPLPSAPTLESVPDMRNQTIDNTPIEAPSIVAESSEDRIEPAANTRLRPSAPVPTRSSIAQSSFSWMLEPNSTPPTASGKSLPPTASSPFLKSGRRPTAGPGREKAAFLFGDDGGDTPPTNDKLASLVGDFDEGYKLGTIKGSKDR
ncbi:TBC1 domain family member 5 [Hyphodiscus hymeniophilus]|uniref:TBC1 domain family member 5 n=1 Tax=Hyphodiscus hymeniophilus TaxID=353542 RepID=A0A9P7B0G5_9HELO|nr:TBC1 domain family member 5 [Hyphodiscus hymeniophilus]